MSESTLLQFLLFFQVFILGALASYGYAYYRRHFRSSNQTIQLGGAQPPENILSPELKRRLIEEAEIKMSAALNNTSSKLNTDLETEAIEINRLVKRLATDIVSGEMEKYRVQLGDLHKDANSKMAGIREDVAKHQTEVQARIDKELEAEKQQLVQQIDTKLADAMASFLSETLQHNVDLGNQSQYLMAMLEEHKADFIREVGTDAVETAT